jgi:glutamyl-tRNA synthetase
MHLGNAAAALVAWLAARRSGDSIVLRIEDLDRARVKQEFTAQLKTDLTWLGLDWDEGPYIQSERIDLYRQAFDRLRNDGRLYPCFCTRRDVAAAAGAPQTPGEEALYPGTCRQLDTKLAESKLRGGARHAWRFRVADGPPPSYNDAIAGPWPENPDLRIGDFVVWRSDETPAYQLAVTVDDAAMKIEEVVRGNDLRSSAARQLMLFEALGLKAPRFVHLPLLVDDEGVRLSKRQQGITIRELREAGNTSEGLTGRLAHLLGLADTAVPITPVALITDFNFEAITAVGSKVRLQKSLDPRMMHKSRGGDSDLGT